ncbi:hypothetical protein D3C75_812510 [compost metagenome]
MVTTIPMSMSAPNKAVKSGVTPEIISATIAPMAASGSENIIASGARSVLKVSTIIRYTSPIEISAVIPRSLKSPAWSAEAPPANSVTPSGSVMLSVCFLISAPIADTFFGSTSAVIRT